MSWADIIKEEMLLSEQLSCTWLSVEKHTCRTVNAFFCPLKNAFGATRKSIQLLVDLYASEAAAL